MQVDIGTISVLVVDDDDRVRESVIRLLTEEGFDTQGTPDGLKALAMMDEKFFDVVLLDLIMPQMTGIDVMHELLVNYPYANVVVLSAVVDTPTLNIAWRAGVFACVAKPCKVDVLAETIRRAAGAAGMSARRSGKGTKPAEDVAADADEYVVRPGVLVVDADDRARKDLCRTLAMEGYKGVGAANGGDALEKIARGDFQVALLNANLPDMDGIDLLARIVEKRPGLVPIVLSGFGDVETMQAAFAARAFDYLIKPCSTRVLLGAIQSAMERPAPKTSGFKRKYSKGRNVMVVDDDDRVRENLVRYLSTEGYDVVGAIDGSDALFKFSQERFSVVVLDLGLPKMDGMQVLKQIRDSHPGTFVVVLSAFDPVRIGREATADELVRDGAFASLRKPCKLEDLVTTIDEAFRQEAKYWQERSVVIDGAQPKSEEDVWQD